MSFTLGGLPIFYETFGAGRHTDFDFELDTLARAGARARGSLAGVCNLAGEATEFLVSSDNLREDIVSPSSGAINRHRQLVCALSLALFRHPHATLAGIAAHVNRHRLRLYLAEAHSPLSRFLGEHLAEGLFVCSEYYGEEHRSGAFVGGVLHQDLQRTSFPDGAFDIVLTCEVFEHIADAPAAEREVARILKPGGAYCFTVPFLPDSEHDLVLAEAAEGGGIKYHAEPQYHGDPIRPDQGVLVYRLFSYPDMKRRFEELGCEFTTYRLWSKALGILDTNGWVHAVRKTGGGAPPGAPPAAGDGADRPDLLAQLDDARARLRARDAEVSELRWRLGRQEAAASALKSELATALELLAAARDQLARAEEALGWARTSRLGQAASALRRVLQVGAPARLARRLRASDAHFRGAVETPAEGATCSGELEVSGWVYSPGSAVTRVEVFVGGEYLGLLDSGRERPDVAAEGAPLRCGFAGRCRLVGVPAGRRELTVRVFDEAGRRRLYRRSFTHAPRDAG